MQEDELQAMLDISIVTGKGDGRNETGVMECQRAQSMRQQRIL